MSYGIIFIGRGVLNTEDFGRYVENHYVCEEYLQQSSSYNKDVRESIAQMRKTPQFLQYIARYKKTVLSTKVRVYGRMLSKVSSVSLLCFYICKPNWLLALRNFCSKFLKDFFHSYTITVIRGSCSSNYWWWYQSLYFQQLRDSGDDKGDDLQNQDGNELYDKGWGLVYY